MRLNKLFVLVYGLREWVTEAGGTVRLDHSLEPVLHELETMRTKFTAEAAFAGSIETSSVSARDHPAQYHPPAFRSVEKFAAKLLTNCKACGRSACALLQTAQVAGDREFARLACRLMRELERLFWVLKVMMERVRPFGRQPKSPAYTAWSSTGLSHHFFTPELNH